MVYIDAQVDDQHQLARGSSHQGGADGDCKFEEKFAYAEVIDLKEDSHTWVHWLWDELQSTREEDRWL